jgi:RNA recognition motif-containing protein
VFRQSFNEKAHCVNGYVTFRQANSIEEALKKYFSRNVELVSDYLFQKRHRSERTFHPCRHCDRGSTLTATEHNRICGKYFVWFDKNVFFLDFIHPFLDAHEDSIREFFASCGAVVAVRVIRERSQPLHKGVAYVSFMVR